MFKDIKYKASLDYATVIKNEIYGEPLYMSCRDFFNITIEELKKCKKPYKETLLHDYIHDSIAYHTYEELKDHEDLVYDDYYKLLDSYGVGYVANELYTGEQLYRHYLYDLMMEIMPRISDSVFHILFSNRELMREFNRVISEQVSSLKLIDYPSYLKRNGVILRCNYWPTWLLNALNRREQGHCAICQIDLTGLLSHEKDIAIDHIIPLNLGGVNDPTNLQLLCGKCNGKKSGNDDSTSDIYSTYW